MPSLSPAWGSDETLWIAYLFKSSTSAVTGYPASYTDGTNTTTSDATSGATAASARRELETATEDPGAFTAGGSSATFTVAIRPSAVAVPDAPTLYPDDGGSNQIAFNNTRQNDNTPIVRASATHTADFNRFQVEFNTQSDFGGTAYTETFSPGPYSSGTQYNLQTTGTLALPTTNGVTYYVRARASADGGTNYGAWSTANNPVWSFTYTSTAGDANWFQTTDEQFDTGTLSSTQTTGSDSVELGGGATIAKAGTDTSGTSAAGTDTSLTFSHTLVSGSNRMVVVAVGVENAVALNDPPTSVTYGGVSMTRAISHAADNGTAFRAYAEIWYILEANLPADGARDVVISISGTPNTIEINGFAAEYTGVSQGAPEATHGVTATSGTVVTNTISPSSGAWVISAIDAGTNWTFTHNEGQVEVFEFVDTSSSLGAAELRGANGETSLSTTVSATINTRVARVAASWVGTTVSSGTIMSPEIDFDWVSGQDTWGEAAFSTTETSGDVKLRVYYTVSTACDTIVPDGTLSGNSSGFDVSASPIDISGLTPVATTYNRICLQATLTDSGSTPFLNDWTVTWGAAATVSCDADITSTAFGTLTPSSVFTASPNASTTMTCGAPGCTLSITSANAGLATSTPAYTIPSTSPTQNLESGGTEGYGITATTTAGGSGGTLAIYSRYDFDNGGSTVGGLTTGGFGVASSTAAITNRQLIIKHRAAISVLTNAAQYEDTLTYSCAGN